jgi:hypothetical protein
MNPSHPNLPGRARFSRLALLVLTTALLLACNLAGVVSPDDASTIMGLAATVRTRDEKATMTAEAWAPMASNPTLDAQWTATRCACTGLPLESASARADSLSCYYTWTVADGTQTLRQKVETFLTLISDREELATRLAAQAEVLSGLGGTWIREGETAFFHTRRQSTGNSFVNHPYLYYGSVRASLEGRYLLSVDLRGYDYTSQAHVENILHSLKRCMEEAVAP